jgi:heme-degrading monooxygenase HmoA
VGLLGGPDGSDAIVVATAWDSLDDVHEFLAAARDAIEGHGVEASIGSSGRWAVLVVGLDTPLAQFLAYDLDGVGEG